METTVLDRPNARVHVRKRPAADGRWIVFLHGAGMDGHMFDAQVPAVPSDIGVCVWDARGHGESTLEGPFRYEDMVEDLRVLIAGLGARDLTLVGQSLGGHLTQTYVERRPQDVARMVLINCSDNHGPLTRTEKLLLASWKPMFRATSWRWAVAQSARACGNERSTVEYARRALESIGRRRFLEVMDFGDVLRPDPGYLLPIPALLLCGDDDVTGNVRAAMPRMAARNPEARLVIITGAGHNSNMDRPESTNRHLVEFLEGDR